MRPYLLAECNYKEIKGRSIELAILPWGAVEAHNYHLPYSSDVIESDNIAAAAAEKAYRQGANIIVFPTIPYGVNTGQPDVKLDLNINPSTQAAKGSFFISGFLETDLGGNFTINGELGYNGKGNRIEYETVDDQGKNYINKTNFSLNYLDFQILVNFSLISNLYLTTGLNTSILLSANVNNEIHNAEVIESFSTDIKEFLTTADLGLVAGIGYVTPIGILLEVKYDFGLVNIVSEEFNEIGNLKNRQLSVGIGYRF